MPAPPKLLIHLHIPKTGGTTLNSVLRRAFSKTEFFNSHMEGPDSALWSTDQSRIAQKWTSLRLAEREEIRCISGGHLSLGADAIFGPSAKYLALVRDPFQRAVSHYRFLHLYGKRFPIWPAVREMTFEEYLDSRIDLGPHNFQVRILSGCAELNAPFGSDGIGIAFRPVMAHHFESAKRNIEQRFFAIAPLEEFSSVIALLRSAYDWPLRHSLFEPLNVGEFQDCKLSASLRKRVAALNRYDVELFEWVSTRFAAQIACHGDQFARERRRLANVNGAVKAARHVIPTPLRSLVAKLALSRSTADGIRTTCRRAFLVYREFLRCTLSRMRRRSAEAAGEWHRWWQWIWIGALAAMALGEASVLFVAAKHIGARAVIAETTTTTALGVVALVYWTAFAALAISDDATAAAAIPARARKRIGFGLTGAICLIPPGLMTDAIGLLLFTGRPATVLALSLCLALHGGSPI